MLIYDEKKNKIQIGNEVEAEGKLSFFETARNPGNFNQKAYYQRQNIHGKVWSETLRITDHTVKQILNVLAQEIYIPDVNRAIEAYRDEADEEVIYSQRELEAMFDYSFNTGLSATADTGYTYSSSIDNPDKIIYYYLRKDLQGAVGAVKKFGNEGNRRRINQLYLFLKGYKFIDGADEALKPHRDELGF